MGKYDKCHFLVTYFFYSEARAEIRHFDRFLRIMDQNTQKEERKKVQMCHKLPNQWT